MFDNVYRDRTVLVTGHTGFKGSWLAVWLMELGARVVGISDAVPTSPSHFESARLNERLADIRIDIRDAHALRAAIHAARPDFIFHLAAQPLVRRSYREPVETIAVNTMGTAHVLDALRSLGHPCVAVMITSDKSYDNVEWIWGYRETDRLGGKDPYSGSKGAAELAIRSFVASYFSSPDCAIRVGVARAGNVIGGGDWAEDRIVPDCVRAWADQTSVEIRNPKSIRPWQHVLEPLSGYLALGAKLSADRTLHGEPFNFGPPAEQNHSVGELVEAMQRHWPGAECSIAAESSAASEAQLLKLNCDKALATLHWRSTLNFAETVQMTAEWYREFYSRPDRSILDMTLNQINDYVAAARARGLEWAQ